MARQQRIIIVGGGIVGLSTAYALLKQGMKQVVVLEQAKVDSRRSMSSGPSRLLRFEYGMASFYSQMAQLSLSRWKKLQDTTQRALYTPTGLLTLGNADDHFTLPSYSTLKNLGLPTERVSEQHCRQYFPQFATAAFNTITYNAEAGILHASNCLRTLKELILDLGGSIYEASRITHFATGNPSHPISLYLQNGEKIEADRVVIAAGAWVHHLLADLHLPVKLTRQYLLYFSGLPNSSFGVEKFPAFFANDLYGFPILNTYNEYGSGCLKAASHNFGTFINPDQDLPLEERVIGKIIRALRNLLPALQDAKLAHVDACMYDVTPDEDFILDFLPYDSRIVFATGLSGHGFKFGLLLGELMSSMVCGTEPQVSLEHFKFTRFTHQAMHATSSVA